jgi:hypothetical protein
MISRSSFDEYMECILYKYNLNPLKNIDFSDYYMIGELSSKGNIIVVSLDRLKNGRLIISFIHNIEIMSDTDIYMFEWPKDIDFRLIISKFNNKDEIYIIKELIRIIYNSTYNRDNISKKYKLI